MKFKELMQIGEFLKSQDNNHRFYIIYEPNDIIKVDHEYFAGSMLSFNSHHFVFKNDELIEFKEGDLVS